MNISFNLNQRLQLDAVNDDLEIEIKSINRFGIFGSSSPKLVASIVSHDWFHPFDGEVIIYVLMIIALIEIIYLIYAYIKNLIYAGRPLQFWSQERNFCPFRL